MGWYDFPEYGWRDFSDGDCGRGSYGFCSAEDEVHEEDKPKKKRRIGINADELVEDVKGSTGEFVESLKESRLVAKKDFEIHQNEYHREIKAGEDISDVPECYIPNLKTEGVL